MKDNSFFDESMEQSQVKAEIVAKYFWAWARVIIPTAKNLGKEIAYIDLFSGPGRYKDGSKSTPLLVLEKAVNDPKISERLITIFNDVNSDNTQSLQEAIKTVTNIEHLKHKPQVLNLEVGSDLVRKLAKIKFIPSLFFIDPWGYKGLSLRLFSSVIKDWGCDCIFFFNYNRIKMGIRNQALEERMNDLFGKERAGKLRKEFQSVRTHEREAMIVENICQALKEVGGKYVLPFRFRKIDKNMTSHHLIFVSKSEKGYKIMKEIMAKESSSQEQGVPTFEYNPATLNQPLLFELNRPLDELLEMLLTEFAGKTLTMKEVYRSHHVGRRYIEKNYKDALKLLESQGKIAIDPPAQKRKKGTLKDEAIITFPFQSLT